MSDKQTCPECGRLVSVMVPFGSTKLSFANHHRPHGKRCPMAMLPVPDEGSETDGE